MKTKKKYKIIKKNNVDKLFAFQHTFQQHVEKCVETLLFKLILSHIYKSEIFYRRSRATEKPSRLRRVETPRKS